LHTSREAKIELGEAIAARLKLSEDGTKVLWPPPTDSALDPQNWSTRRKNLQLFVITLAAAIPDFDSGIGERRESDPFSPILDLLLPGIAAIFALGTQYDTTPGVINNLTSKHVTNVLCHDNLLTEL
jgi:hypothetical protein